MANNINDSNEMELSWIQMIGSTLAATFGVQNSKNRERDFTHGEIKKFVIVAIGLTGVFLLLLLGIVKLALLDV